MREILIILKKLVYILNFNILIFCIIVKNVFSKFKFFKFKYKLTYQELFIINIWLNRENYKN